jgi:hypothetical protein
MSNFRSCADRLPGLVLLLRGPGDRCGCKNLEVGRRRSPEVTDSSLSGGYINTIGGQSYIFAITRGSSSLGTHKVFI